MKKGQKQVYWILLNGYKYNSFTSELAAYEYARLMRISKPNSAIIVKKGF